MSRKPMRRRQACKVQSKSPPHCPSFKSCDKAPDAAVRHNPGMGDRPYSVKCDAPPSVTALYFRRMRAVRSRFEPDQCSLSARVQFADFPIAVASSVDCFLRGDFMQSIWGFDHRLDDDRFAVLRHLATRCAPWRGNERVRRVARRFRRSFLPARSAGILRIGRRSLRRSRGHGWYRAEGFVPPLIPHQPAKAFVEAYMKRSSARR